MGVWEKMTDDNDRGGEATSNPQDPHLLRWTFPFPPCQNLYGLTIQISKKSEISDGEGGGQAYLGIFPFFYDGSP